MTNKALFFWVSVGLTLAVALVYSFVLAQKRKKEAERLSADLLQLRQQNGALLAENRNFRNGGDGWGTR